jgi:hypothetical protein
MKKKPKQNNNTKAKEYQSNGPSQQTRRHGKKIALHSMKERCAIAVLSQCVLAQIQEQREFPLNRHQSL